MLTRARREAGLWFCGGEWRIVPRHIQLLPAYANLKASGRASMLRWFHFAAFLLLSCASLADNVTFLRIDKSLVEQRVQQQPQSPEQRVTTLRAMFEKAGCAKPNIQVQTVPDQSLPNVICTLPDTEYGTILIAARLDYDGRGGEGPVGWGGVAMLPLLPESLNSTSHRHTLVFSRPA